MAELDDNTAPDPVHGGGQVNPADPFQVDAGQVLLGRFRIVRKLGEGGQAVVYHAEDVKLGRQVAIKFMKLEAMGAELQTALERFRREARILATLSHRSSVLVFDIGTYADGATPFMVMEFLSGESLLARLVANDRSGKRMPWREAFQLIDQAADALGLAHAQQPSIVHRDLKPENLFLCTDGTLKVLDFGIARLVDDISTDDGKRPARLTSHGLALGTPSYMSPEQLRGARDLDGRTDVYSLGVVLYNLLSNRRPWGGRRKHAQLVQALAADEKPEDIRHHLPELPEEVAAVVRKAIALDRDQRFQSMEELRDAMRAATSALNDAGRDPTTAAYATPASSARIASDSARHPTRLLAWKIAASAVLVAAAAVVLLVANRRNPGVRADEASRIEAHPVATPAPMTPPQSPAQSPKAPSPPSPSSPQPSPVATPPKALPDHKPPVGAGVEGSSPKSPAKPAKRRDVSPIKQPTPNAPANPFEER